MKKIQISTDRILLLIIVILLWYATLLKACESDTDFSQQPTIAFTKDTSWQPKNEEKRNKNFKQHTAFLYQNYEYNNEHNQYK